MMRNLYSRAKRKIRRTLNILSNFECYVPGTDCVAYTGWIGRDNLGDEALFAAHRDLFSPFKLKVFSDFLLPMPNKSKINCPYRFGILGGGSLLFGGGTYLKHVRSMLNADLPIFCLGTGVDLPPIYQHIEKMHQDPAEWIDVLSSFEFVGVRGPLSRQFLENCGFNKAEIVGDTALSLAKKNYVKKSGHRVLGLNISSVSLPKRNQEIFLGKVRHAVQMLIRRGWNVILFPSWCNDEKIINDLAIDLGSDHCRIVSQWLSIPDYLNATEECDIFIGEKLHSVVMAMLTRTPSIMLEYHLKCRDFMMSMGFEEFCHLACEIEPEILIENVGQLYKRLPQFQGKIDKHVSELALKQRTIAKEMMEKFYRRI